MNPDRVKHTVTLTPEEWNVFFLVDGRRSLGEICRLAGDADEAATLQILHALVRARVRDRGAAAAARQRLRRAGRSSRSPTPDASRRCKSRRAPSVRVSVEFSSGMRSAKLDDDTNEIVTPEGGRLPGEHAARSRSSRLVLVADGQRDLVPARPRHLHARPPPQQRHRDLRPQGLVLPRAHRPRHARASCSIDLKSRNGTFAERQAHRDRRCSRPATRSGWAPRACSTRSTTRPRHDRRRPAASRVRSPFSTEEPLPEIAPFAGIRYRVPDAELTKVLAPPYDVIPPAYQDELYDARPAQHRARGAEPRRRATRPTARPATPSRRWLARGRAGRGRRAVAVRARADVHRRRARRSRGSACWRASAPRTPARARCCRTSTRARRPRRTATSSSRPRAPTSARSS